MLFVLNKNKIFSYAVAASIVVCLFLFSITINVALLTVIFIMWTNKE